MTINHYFNRVFLALLFLIVANITAFYFYQYSDQQLKSLEYDRLSVMELSSHIRETSNKLTRTSRTFVVTNDAIYLSYFNELLDFRYGRKPRPEHFFSIYWDKLQTKIEEEQDKKIPLKNIVDSLITPKEQLVKLRTAVELADVLTEIEIQAIQIFQSHKANSKQQALDILYGATYLKAKSEIMGHIDDFQDIYDVWHFQQTSALEQQIKWARLAKILLQLSFIIALIYIRFFIIKNVSKPLSSLANFAKNIAKGNLSQPSTIASDTADIRVLMQAMNQMQNEIALTLSKFEQQTELAEQAKHQAQMANKSRGEFLANMSHEIRTPMNGIIGLGQLLQQQKLTSEDKAFVDKILLSAKQLLTILNDILDFSKIDSDKLQIENIDFALRGVFDRIANVLAIQAQNKQLQLKFDIATDMPQQCFGDPIRIGQILMNMTSNAIKFTDRGEVIVSVEQIKTIADEYKLVFTVTDTGVGLSVEKMQHIFEPFSQADNSITRNYGGTGLGLTISKRLASLMQGDIKVSSVVAKGSRFSLTLPVIKSIANKVYKLQSKPILLISDCLHNQRLVQQNAEYQAINYHQLTVNDLDINNPLFNNECLMVLDLHTMTNDEQMHLASKYEHVLINENIDLILLTNINQIGSTEHFSYKRQSVQLHCPLIFSDIENQLRCDKPAINDEKISNSLAGINVLLAEDFKLNQIVAKGLLNKLGVNVDIVEDGQQAVDAINEKSYQLVFMDIHMPNMDGHQATRIIRSNKDFDALPIIALTADAQQEHVKQCIDSGMNDFISKPFLLADIEKIMHKHLD
ncbi:ATP-binding protein [Colwelliaceae bacterium BS250]